MKKQLKVLLIFAACAILAATSVFINNNYIVILIDQILINIIVLMGLNFVTGMIGQMNLGTAGIMAIGAYTTALLCTKLGMSPWVAMLFVIVMGILVGICIGYPSLRIKGIYLALTTLGFSEIVRIVITNLVDLTGGPSGIRAIPGLILRALNQGCTRVSFPFLPSAFVYDGDAVRH